MPRELHFLDLFLPAAVFMGVFGITMLLRKFIYGWVEKWARKSKTNVDNLVIQTIKTPSVFWCIILGLYLGLSVSNLAPKNIAIANKILGSLIILSMTLVAAGLLAQIIKFYLGKSAVAFPATGLSQTLAKAIILIIGFLILMNNLGISITPLITALGIGGLAVALALQDSLSNLFSGIHILIERPLKVGDYIKLDSGEEGYVIDVGWRTTRVRMVPNNIIVIPNKRVTESIITNYYLPERRMALFIPIGVSYDSDPEEVEKVLLEETNKAVKEVPGMLEDPPPSVRFMPGFGDFSLDFTLVCQIKEFIDQYHVQTELRKRIFKRFKKEGIEIPFPITTIYMRNTEDGRKGV